MPKSPDPFAKTKRIMAEMLKLPPKEHSDMKVGKTSVKKKVSKKPKK